VESTLALLAEPSRRMIVDALLDGEQSVSALVDLLNLSQPNVSKHLRVLRDAGVVDVRPLAQQRLYRLRPQPFAELDAWLAPYRKLWNERLDALGRVLDEMEDE
jgi:DNA-binding transcriptional ArsR family regulator